MGDDHKIRWFQFSLKRLFVVVAACAVVSATIPYAIAAYTSWQWSKAGGPGYIKPFAPIRCFAGDSDDAGDDQREPAVDSRPAP